MIIGIDFLFAKKIPYIYASILNWSLTSPLLEKKPG